MKNVRVAVMVFIVSAIAMSAQTIPGVDRDSTSIQSAFNVGSVDAQFEMPADAFVLSQLSGAADPFYHASGLLFAVPRLTIDSIASVQLRFAAEVWNFSASYQSDQNLFLWAKPLIALRIPVGGVIDSVRIMAGDLWRVTVGQGLAMDYFEAQGSNLRVVSDKVAFELTTIGYGWTGHDDNYIFSLGYDSVARVNVFTNHYNDFFELDPYGSDRVMLSFDGSYSAKGVTAWTEQAYMLNVGYAFLLGMQFEQHLGWLDFAVSAEYRKYPDQFFSESFASTGEPFEVPMPYFNSLTALNKPVKTYHSFIDMNSAFYARLTGTLQIYEGWFVGTDTEYFEEIYTDTYAGYRIGTIAEATIGYLNKAFVLYSGFDPRSNMFTTIPMWTVRLRARI